MHCLKIIAGVVFGWVLFFASGDAIASVTSVQPRSCKPGATTQLTLIGKDLNQQLRVITSALGAIVKIESVEPEKAIVSLALPENTPLGPLGIWTATQTGPGVPLVMLVDDLPTVNDNGNNHSLATAQTIETLAAVDGLSDGSQSDFYRITASKGQRLAFEVLTQSIESTMDPLVRLLTSDGAAIQTFDDDGVGPEVRFSHEFMTDGEYVLEVRDNRYTAGGHYHLRVGDFPVISHAYPLAISRGSNATINFATADEVPSQPRDVSVAADFLADSLTISSRLTEGKSSTWVPVHICEFESHVEPEDKGEASSIAPLSIPIGISGKLAAANERDQYVVCGAKDALVRFSSRTRSLGCMTLLQMLLFNSAGVKVAETKVTDSDEWSFDYKFADDEEYRLEVTDLLGRGGNGFGYWIDIQPAGTFSLALKGDAKTPEQFTIEPVTGACSLTLQVNRFGYDGEIELALASSATGLRVLNPLIPVKATEAKIYVTADNGWNAESLAAIELIGHAKDNAKLRSRVTNVNVRRLKKPHIAFPHGWNDGKIALAGSVSTDGYFALEPAGPVQFARPVKKHAVTFNLKRLKPEFKAEVSVLSSGLPSEWTVDVKVDKDAYTANFTLSGDNTDKQPELPLLVYSEFNGRGRVDAIKVPIEWIDPLQVTVDSPEPLVAGSTASVKVSLKRTGAAQAVTLKAKDLPVGLEAPETLTIAADQSIATIELKVAADIDASKPITLAFEAMSKYRDSDFLITAQSSPLRIIASAKSMEVYPNEISLADKKAKRQLVVTGYDDKQIPRDWTGDVVITSANPEIAEVRGTIVYPVANGETEIHVQLGTLHQSVLVRVANMETASRTLFESDVLVALSKQGCNSGACHGSPSGKGMFRLSLRAFDRSLDELTLIREDFGRRVNCMEPEESLLLLKPLMKVGHGGGKQLSKDDAAYKILTDWIREGAMADPVGTPRCVRLEIFPHSKRVLQRIAGHQQLAVTAHFADGTHRDVTDIVAYETSNTAVATVDAQGLVTAQGRGEAVILVRYLEHIESAPLMFIEPVANFAWNSPPPNNYIDEHVNVKLLQIQYLPAETCSDTEFLRRVYLDVIGILPTVDQCNAFLNDAQADKRSQLIDQLLERDEFAKFWALKWGDLLRMTSKLVGDEGVYKYHRWVEDAIRSDMPYDDFARELLTASGSTLSNPPANFYRTSTDMNECVETISQVFLGARLQCAKCHNHPFERWTQDNYYGLGAFFNRVQRRKTQRVGEMFVWATEAGEVTQPRTGEQMKPWLPVAGNLEDNVPGDRREALAQWLVSPENPYFAKIGANRIWSQLFARGIVDPVDDFRDSNPPTNEPLLDALAKDFIDGGFSTKHLLRSILNSRTYQASHLTNDFNQDDTLYFSHQQPRLLTAEQLLDAVNHVTGISQTFGNLPVGTKATQLPAPDVVKVDFLKVFGQPERSTVCACERVEDSNLGMAIELFNGPMIHERLRDPQNRFRIALAAGTPLEEVLKQLYFAAVCRLPSEVENAAALEHCKKREDIAAGLEDVCWALMNTDEFLFQH